MNNWKSMDTAPRDGKTILVGAEIPTPTSIWSFVVRLAKYSTFHGDFREWPSGSATC